MKFRLLVRRILRNILSDKSYLKAVYFLTFKRRLNLKNPIYWTEKVQYKKLYDRTDKITQVADKIAVRDYCSRALNEDIMPELYWIGDNPKDIPFERLPKAFVIKTNHGSGTNIIVENKELINQKNIIGQLEEWLKKDYYILEKEWAYKNIKRKVFVEKLYLDENNQVPKDIKLYMFNGVLGAINIHTSRFADNHENLLLDPNFMDLYISDSDRSELKPKHFTKMLDYAKILSEEFDFIRVDFYEFEDKVLLGELTNYPVGGYKHMPPSVDKYLGDMWKIQ